MPIYDEERKKRLNGAFNEKLKQDAIEKLRFEREGINTPPETIVQPEAKPEAMPEVFYGGRTEPPSKTEARFIDMLRNVPSNTGVASIYQRSPYELSNMSTLQQAREGDLKSQLEMYYSPPTGTTRMSEFQRAKVEGKEKATLAQLLGEQARERAAIGSAGIAAESAEKRQAMEGLGGIEEERMRGETELEKERMKPLETKAPQIKSMSIGKGMLQDMIFNPNTGQYDIPFGKPHREFSPSQSQRERYQVKVDEQGKLWRLDVDTNKLIPIEAPEGTKFTKPEKEKDWIEQQLENTAKQGGYKWENGKLVPY